MKNTAKRLLALCLTLAMVFTMLPVGALARTTKHEGDGIAVYQEDDGSYTLEVLDGATTQAELYAAFTSVMGEPLAGGLDTFTQKTFKYGDTTIYNGDTDVSLSNSTISVQKSTGASGFLSRSTVYGTAQQFAVKVYHNITVSSSLGTTAGGVTYKNVEYKHGDVFKYYPGDTDEIAPIEVTNYKATGKAPDGTGTYTVEYSSLEAPKHTVTINVTNSGYGTTTVTAAGTAIESGAQVSEGDTIVVTALPTDAASTSVSISVDGTAVTSGYSFKMGTGDVTVSVSYSALTGAGSANVPFNGYTEITVADQMNGGTYFADVANHHCLERAIFEALAVNFSPADAELTWDKVTYEYLAENENQTMAKVKSVWSALNAVPENDKGNTGLGNYAYYAFANDGIGDVEHVRLTYKGLSIEADITLVEGREKATINYTKPAELEFESEDEIVAAVLAAASTNSSNTITVTRVTETLPSGGQSATLTYKLSVAEDANYLANEIEVTIDVKAKSNPAQVNITVNGTGSVTVGSLTASGTLAAGTYTITATPGDWDGSDGAASYVASITVDGKEIAGDIANYSNGTFTGTNVLTIENDTTYNIIVTFAERELALKVSPVTVSANGYNTDTKKAGYQSALTAANFVDFESCVGGSTEAVAFTVQMQYSKIDGLGTTSAWGTYDDIATWYATTAFDVPAASKPVRVIWSGDARYPAITSASVIMKVEESRVAPTITLDISKVNGKSFDTEEAFKAAVEAAITVTDVNGTTITADSGVTVDYSGTFPGAYTLTVKVTKDGATWLTTSKTFNVTCGINTYTVTWVVDGKTSTETYNYGETPAFTGSTDKAADAQYTYTFAGWSPEIAAVTGNVTYTAQYDKTVNTYTVTWIVDGVATMETYEYGATPSFKGSTDKAADAQYTYTFTGWDKGIATVTGDVTYTAQYDKTVNTYTVTWSVDGKSTTETYNYGAVPSFKGSTDKAADAQYTYTFTGWDKEITAVTGDVTYTAQYSETLNEYTITFVNADEAKTVLQSGKWKYGETPVYSGATPTLPDSEDKTYTFLEWSPVITAVTGDAVYTATYSDKDRYNVTIVWGNGTTDTVYKVEAGQTINVPETPKYEGYRFDGWYVDEAYQTAFTACEAKEDTIIYAKWVKQYTYTYETAYHTAPTGQTVDVGTVITIADLLAVGDVTDNVVMDGWYVDGVKVSGEYTVEGDVTFTAKWLDDKDNDNLADGSEADPFLTYIWMDGEEVLKNVTILSGAETPTYTINDPADNGKLFSRWTTSVEGNTTTYTAHWIADANNNDVADSLETLHVSVTGSGTVTVDGVAVTNGTDYLYDSKLESHTIVATPADLDGSDGAADYVKSLTVNNASDLTETYASCVLTAGMKLTATGTLTVEFDTLTVEAKNNTVKVTGWAGNSGLNYEYRANGYKAVLTTGNFLQSGSENGTFDVEMNTRTGWMDVDELNAYHIAYLDVPATKSVRIVWTPEDTDRYPSITSNTATAIIQEARTTPGLRDMTVNDVQTFASQDELTAYVNGLLTHKDLNPNGVSVTAELTTGEWPKVADTETTLVYTVTYAESAEYLGQTCKLTIVMKTDYSNCTVVADTTVTAGGSMAVNGTAGTTVTVPGNSTTTVVITPSGSNVVESITVKTGDTAVETSEITYADKAAMVTFTSDGKTGEVQYTVSATYSTASLVLNNNETIEYCVDDQMTKGKLKELIFAAVYQTSTPALKVDDVTIEYAYLSEEILGQMVNLWADVTSNPTIEINGVTHKFGESGSETVRVTYESDKYGTLQQTVTLNVYDSCYNNTITVETVTNDADAAFKVTYPSDSRAYNGVTYYKSNTQYSVALTPDGEILDTLGQVYNGTYSNAMAYIKNVTVQDAAGNVVASTLERGKSELSLDNILSGVTPNLYNATVKFTGGYDQDYTIVAEYGILEMNAREGDVTLNMYQGGKDYPAEAPSAEELFEAVIGNCSDDFLKTYSENMTVEFSADSANYTWTAVSDEALLALADNTTIKVRVTWSQEDQYTYYPVAITKDVTLVDQRTATSITGTVPATPVEFVEEDQLIANLKEAMGFEVKAGETVLEGAAYTVTYLIEGNETDGYTVDVTVTYDGSVDYKPSTETFENIPVADLPGTTTVTVSGENGAAVVTNNAGVEQTAVEGVYTVTGNAAYTFTLTPEAGYAIESAAVNGEPVELTYADQIAKFTVTLTEKTENAVVLTAVPAVFTLEDPRVYDFAYGWDMPEAADIADAAIAGPAEIDLSKVQVEYLARTEGTATITIPELQIVGSIAVGPYSFEVDLGELWLAPDAEVQEVDMEEVVDILVDDIMSGNVPLNGIEAYVTNYLKSLTLNAHAFGSGGDGSVETIRVSYEDDKWLIGQTVTDVTIRDARLETTVVGETVTVVYNNYTKADVLGGFNIRVQAGGADVTVETDKIVLADEVENLDAGTYSITAQFLGNADYKPSEAELTLVVNKAPCSIDYDSQVVVYGDPYTFELVKNPEEVQTIDFMIGIDVKKMLDNGEYQGVEPYVQLVLPPVDTIFGEFELPAGTYTVSQLKELLNSFGGEIEALNELLDILDEVMNELGFTDLTLKVGGEMHPEHIGVYLAGAVTVDPNYETAYTVDYLIVVPKATEVELDWKVKDDNGFITLDSLLDEENPYDMDAYVKITEAITAEMAAEAEESLKYLFLGMDVNGDFVMGDEVIKEIGAYTELAYVFDWGNEMYYAVPIVRAYVVVADSVDVKFVDESGAEITAATAVYDGEPHGMTAKAYEKNTNNELSSENLTYTYIGIESDAEGYYSHEAPTQTGVYSVVATYLEKNEDGQTVRVGVAVGLLTILPSNEASVEVTDIIRGYDWTMSDIIADMVTVTPADADVIIIEAGVDVNGDFTDDGWDVVDAAVKVDVPQWLDELLQKWMPNEYENGVSAATFMERLNSYKDELALLGIGEESIQQLEDALNQLPENVTLQFVEMEEVSYNEVGLHLVTAVVFDFNYVPAMDSGILLITPTLEDVELKWTQEFENNLVSLTLLQSGQLDLSAYAYMTQQQMSNDNYTQQIKYLFICVDEDGVHVSDTLDNAKTGVVTEIAILAEVGDYMAAPTAIMRTLIIAPETVQVDVTGGTYAYGEFEGAETEVTVPDGAAYDPDCLTVRYVGLNVEDGGYNSTVPPTEIGAYIVTATYVEYDENGDVLRFGMDVDTVIIKPLESGFAVNDVTVVYDGQEHFSDCIVNDDGLDYIAVVTDEFYNVNIIMTGTDRTESIDVGGTISLVQTALPLVEDMLPAEITGNPTLSALVDKLLEEVENLLEKIDFVGTFSINGDLPTDVGVYDIKALAYGENTMPVYDDGVLTILEPEEDGDGGDEGGDVTPEGVVEAPTFTPAPGTYLKGETLSVTIQCATEGATIYYTTDGSDPRTSDTAVEYNGESMEITEQTTFRAYAVKEGMEDSKVSVATYKFARKTPTPVIIPDGGVIDGSQEVEIKVRGASGATIYYTIDGSEPTTDSPVYTGPFTLEEPAEGDKIVVKAIAVIGSLLPSDPVEAEFTGENDGDEDQDPDEGDGDEDQDPDEGDGDEDQDPDEGDGDEDQDPDEGDGDEDQDPDEGDGDEDQDPDDGDDDDDQRPDTDTSWKPVYGGADCGCTCDGDECACRRFDDVSAGDWFHEDVCSVFRKGLMNGVSENLFQPNGATTRGMIVTILWRLEGQPELEGSGRFRDVNPDRYYAEAIQWADENGVVNGYDDVTFGPDDPITREQMAAILFRYAGFKGYDVSARADLGGYVDAGEISAYAVEAMEWANAEGLINGMPGNILEPRGGATRAQVAAILNRYCRKFAE